MIRLTLLTIAMCFWASHLEAGDLEARDLIRLDFAPDPLARFAEELTEIRRRNGLLRSAPGEPPPIRLTFDRAEARPGERWLEGRLTIAPTLLGDAIVDVELYAPGARSPIARVSANAERAEGSLFVDLRSAQLPNARLAATLRVAGKPLGVAEAFVSRRSCSAPLQPGQRIPILLDAPDGVNAAATFPVTFGVPFFPGSVWDISGLRVVNAAGHELPHQKEIVARWAKDGAVKWVRFDALVTPLERCFVEVNVPQKTSGPTLRIVEREGKVTVDTGEAMYVLGKGKSPVEEIRVAGVSIATSEGARGLYVVDNKGRLASAAADEETLEVEARGPIAACVRFEGCYRTAEGEPVASHITRLEFFAGDPAARIQHTLVLTRDSNEVWFGDIGWELAVNTGDAATAAFAISREDFRKTETAPIGEGDSAWLLQDRHFHFAHDVNHFVVGRASDDTMSSTLHDGEECGDWFALAGRRGGLGWSCRDAARQHPKEFEVRPDRLVLHLYSSRGGEDLDFRMPALVKKWDLKTWHSHTLPVRDKPKVSEYEKRALAIRHNAAGWAKTHAVLLTPLPAAQFAQVMARVSRSHSHGVFALADPTWTWRTGAAGAMHPTDTRDYPESEAAIAAAVRWWRERIHEFGEYGFVDYYAGPHLSYNGVYPYGKRYHWATYGLRPGLWRAYLRSGDRATREFTSRCNQSFMDNTFAHWDADRKTRGLLLGKNEGGDEPSTPATLPLYWQAATDLHISSSTDFDQLLHDYFLTGNRRAKDVVLQFAEGAKRDWTPAKAAGNWRSLMMMRTLIQVYGFTWDDELLALAEATTDAFSDAAGELGLTKDRPYDSTTYKTQVDVAALLDAWEITGRTRYRELALKASRHWWPCYIGRSPLQYMNPQGRIGHFLFNETGDPSISQVLAQQVRWMGALYDRESRSLRANIDASKMHFPLQGIPYSQDVLARTAAWKQAAVSWMGCDDFGYPVSFVALKKNDKALTLRAATPTEPGAYGHAGGALSVKPLAAQTLWGLDVNRVCEQSNGTALVRVPKDAPGGPYEITPHRLGSHFLFADSRTPLVLHAPGYWQPAPPQDPPVRYFFRVPEDAKDAQIFFDADTRLFDPQGNSYGGEPCRGWVDLPPGKPGLWSFEATHPGLVRVRNAPPFFAVQDPAFWFEPPIAWRREPRKESMADVDPKALYVAGAIELPGNQALHITRGRSLVLEAGPAHANGDGFQFLPFREGCIEFFYKPNWSTFELTGASAPLLTMATNQRGESWIMTHYSYKEGAIDWYQSRSLLAMFRTDGQSKSRNIRCYRRTIFEEGQWVHVAWSWGRPPGAVSTRSGGDLLATQVFINGQPGVATLDRVLGNLPAFPPVRLYTGRGFDGAIDELRCSDAMRYTEPFTPPSRDREFRADRHTRALFHFNESLEGESDETPPVAVVK